RRSCSKGRLLLLLPLLYDWWCCPATTAQHQLSDTPSWLLCCYYLRLMSCRSCCIQTHLLAPFVSPTQQLSSTMSYPPCPTNPAYTLSWLVLRLMSCRSCCIQTHLLAPFVSYTADVSSTMSN
ncbi:unnamed protein product, partial [Pylaiella littoralis]